MLLLLSDRQSNALEQKLVCASIRFLSIGRHATRRRRAAQLTCLRHHDETLGGPRGRLRCLGDDVSAGSQSLEW
eukprot:3770005-Prymnesium_polylepis.1